MQVMAHRGYSGAYPENTMLAFRKAVEAGCDGIELDVHMSRDRVLMVFHDEELSRTTDGQGRLGEQSYAELRRLNAARLWRDLSPQPIPSFEEYCQWAAEQSIFTNIEIKTDHVYYPGIEEKVWDTLVQYGLQERVMFSSFNHFSLLRLQKLVPETVKLGALVLPESGPHINPGDYCREAGFQAFHPALQGLTAEAVQNCHARGIEINAWTVNDMAGLEQLHAWGCEGIITNYPGVAKAWLAGR